MAVRRPFFTVAVGLYGWAQFNPYSRSAQSQAVITLWLWTSLKEIPESNGSTASGKQLSEVDNATATDFHRGMIRPQLMTVRNVTLYSHTTTMITSAAGNKTWEYSDSTYQ